MLPAESMSLAFSKGALLLLGEDGIYFAGHDPFVVIHERDLVEGLNQERPSSQPVVKMQHHYLQTCQRLWGSTSGTFRVECHDVCSHHAMYTRAPMRTLQHCSTVMGC